MQMGMDTATHLSTPQGTDTKSLGQRQAIVATAALRAAIAWSRRGEEPRAWREVARMAGVVMHAKGPGEGPSTPAELVPLLREPLGHLLAPLDGGPALDSVVFLNEDGTVSDDAMEIAGEYTLGLFDGEDPATVWLPRWAWQRAEQVERQLFTRLIRAGDAAAYSASRRFLVEHPAGDERELIEAREGMGARSVAEYIPIPADRVFWLAGHRDGGWWWPCPVCHWPMRVRGHRVECTYGPHAARFLVADDATSGVGPRLLKRTDAALAVPGARQVASARCVEPAVWRFVTIPGVPELELETLLKRVSGVRVEMYPIKDTFDLLVEAPDGRRWTVDVKDHADPLRILDDPPPAEHVVVPRYRRGQLNDLARMLPDKSVWTLDSFYQHVDEHVRKCDDR